ncbi:hypothetical protein [Methylocystis rosea]|uniref:hypothetical protein n=1 Tax=Methylocystis rosea TaxID=173366 RepID=UPI0003825754|nr:hypothetical protein [Methylocystis rosea]
MILSPAAIQFAACAAIAAGAASLYLGAQNQRWLSRPLPGLWSGLAGAALLLLGAFLWSQVVQLSTAIFAALVFIMLLFIVFPALGALRTFIRNAL